MQTSYFFEIQNYQSTGAYINNYTLQSFNNVSSDSLENDPYSGNDFSIHN